MQLLDGVPVYSASDLVGFLACEHLTALERAALHALVPRPSRADPELDVLRRRGDEHERRYLDDLQGRGRSVTRITPDAYADDHLASLQRAAVETEAALARGDDVVYQATFFDGRWRGHADFLERVEAPARPSRWGTYHYEVVDTKLARHVKAGAVLQICSYVDRLTQIQGVEPEWLHVVLGGSARERRTLRVTDYMAYYRAARARFEAAVDAPLPEWPITGSYPDPVEHCRVCRWDEACQARRRQDDHLSLVAGISARQRQALAERGLDTLADLGTLELPVLPPLEDVSAPALLRIRDQARLQLAYRHDGRLRHELIPPDPSDAERGLAMLPAPSPGDLFFDIEGDPYALDDGLDYLFGLMTIDGDWHAFWSQDPSGEFSLEGEKRAFAALVDLLAERMERFPEAHVYHYAPYEPTALKRLMGRHATREDEVDRLLRGGRLVDLYRAVRQGVRASVESYSIKKLEPFYGFERSVELRDATSSIVEFEEWLQLGAGDRPESDLLQRIEAYNRDDVESTSALRDWLEHLRVELTERTGVTLPRPGPQEEEPQPDLSAELAEVERLSAALTDGVPVDPSQRSASQEGRWLLAQLLSWHRRENKSAWWLYYHLRDDLTDEERIDAGEPIGGLVYEGVVDRIDRSLVHRYRFPPQDHDIRAGGGVRDPATGRSPGTVVAVDNAAGTVDLKRGAGSSVPHPTGLIPYEHFSAREHEESLRRLARWVIAHGFDADGTDHRAARDLLLHHPPRLRSGVPFPASVAGEDELTAARRLAIELDHTTLAIQGPPGTGKTYTAARMIVDLVAAGRRVGVTATSHKVIANLLVAVARAASEAAVPVRIGQRASDENLADHPAISGLDNVGARNALRNHELDLVGGTSWLWSREEMADSVDVLFVDEAGQMSLANVLATTQAGASLVLLGDPQQLEQPMRGVHPPGADRSALAHLLGSRATMPGELGLFLETTWRLHPDLVRFTSTVFYDGRLEPEPRLSGQEVLGTPELGGTGQRLALVAHAGNDAVSPEEVERVAQLVEAMVDGGGRWIDRDGQLQLITWQEVLIVAPYNAQVGALQRRMPAARIGTVDKFQGQEAPIVVYSTTSSSAADAPRGLDFLFSRHRLNVATSRARCITMIVASPELFVTRARTAEQMRLANAFCRYRELASGQEDHPAPGRTRGDQPPH